MAKTFVAFEGATVIARGALAEVVLRAKDRHSGGHGERIALFDDETGHALDIDFSGSSSEVVARLADHPMTLGVPTESPKRKGPGRPRLGVVSREVSLLPRHWSWLSDQRSGASATLRRLVDQARKESTGLERMRKVVEAAHRFMWDIAGDHPGFEEASRALFAHDLDGFEARIAEWPQDIREQLLRFTARARGNE